MKLMEIAGAAYNAFSQAAAGPVATQARHLWEVMAAGAEQNPASIREGYEERNSVFAYVGSLVEEHMSGDVNFLTEDLKSKSKKPVTHADVRRLIIEAARDLKLWAFEDDGTVNPVTDLTLIKSMAGAKDMKAWVDTNYSLARSAMQGRNIPGNKIRITLDLLEANLLTATSQNSSDEEWMRSAQAVVWAVAELRLKYLVS